MSSVGRGSSGLDLVYLLVILLLFIIISSDLTLFLMYRPIDNFMPESYRLPWV